MKKFRIIFLTAVIMLLSTCSVLFSGCAQNKANAVNDTVAEDTILDRVSFDKKYYYLGYDGYTENEYYIFSSDGNACYTHIMKNGNTTTFHQEIHFKWTYAGEGDCILVHNGTKMINGAQDDAFGISRVMHLSKDLVYWSASGENTYFICEDFVNQISNYGKLI